MQGERRMWRAAFDFGRGVWRGLPCTGGWVGAVRGEDVGWVGLDRGGVQRDRAGVGTWFNMRSRGERRVLRETALPVPR